MASPTVPRTDLLGQKFERLMPVRYIGGKFCKWLCRCDCGREKTVRSSHLITQFVRSCGCLRRELASSRATTHGASKRGAKRPREYVIWEKMKDRCLRPHNPTYKWYGGRGITICQRWLDYAAFLSDMGPCPPRYELDRIDNDGPYTLENCRWIDHKTQSRNRRSCRYISHAGLTLCVQEWAERTGLSAATIRARLNRGWSNERALTTHTTSRRSAV